MYYTCIVLMNNVIFYMCMCYESCTRISLQCTIQPTLLNNMSHVHVHVLRIHVHVHVRHFNVQ